MRLSTGTQLGSYEILSPLGAGGMGEVYRARDTKLGREVALKVLPDLFANDRDRLARFDREARLLASLNHPNIAAIYGLEEAEGVRFLVLELVSGGTLAERLDSSPPDLEEALTICRQIAEALEAAHEKGIIHRDLKPANVKVTPEGKVKVLDFGLAKAFEPETSPGDLSKSPTASYPTGKGVILGTAPYMSPEQARGKPLDKRTDIWSFGCVLYEALTRLQAFGKETLSDTIAAILRGDPDWKALPENTPARIRDLLRRCLQTDSHRRLHDIADARIEIEEALAATAIGGAWPGRWRSYPWRLTGVVAVLAAAAAGASVWIFSRATPSAPRPLRRFVVSLPPTEPLALGSGPALALSPDGTRLVYVARRGATELYVRPMDRLEATPLAGTGGGDGAFFSPDGRSVGFFADGKLKKLSLMGGEPLTLCEAPDARGASWGPDDTIFFARKLQGGLWRIPASGGTPEPVTSLDSEKGEKSHRWPEILPDGKAVLFTVWTASDASFDDARIAVQSLKTGERRILAERGTYGRYVPTGHLVYARAGTLQAVPFDLARLQVIGSPVVIIEGVMTDPLTGAAFFSFSEDGSLVYVPADPDTSFAERAGSLLWVDLKGKTRLLMEPRREFAQPRLSPDGKRFSVTITEGTRSDVWVSELERVALTRLTFEDSNAASIWTTDSRRITFSSDRAGVLNLFWQPADGSGPAKQLLQSDHPQFASSWSPDGQVLALVEHHPDTGLDILLLPLQGERRPRPFLRTPFNEGGAVFAPDGRWVAYVSNESGQDEVYVRPFPGPGGKWQISTQGGTEPVWARNGRELFYRQGERMMAVAISTEPAFSAGKPKLLFEGHYDSSGAALANYDVDPSGERFVVIRSEQGLAPTRLNVVLEWFEDLKLRARPSRQ